MVKTLSLAIVISKPLLLAFNLWPTSILLAAIAVFPLLLHAPHLTSCFFFTIVQAVIHPSCTVSSSRPWSMHMFCILSCSSPRWDSGRVGAVSSPLGDQEALHAHVLDLRWNTCLKCTPMSSVGGRSPPWLWETWHWVTIFHPQQALWPSLSCSAVLCQWL